MGRRRPRRRHAAACFAAAVAAVLLTGCGGGSHTSGGTSRHPCKAPASGTREHDVVVVLIDRSRSTNAPDVRRNYSDSFQRVLDLFSEGHGGLLAVAPIDESSLGHFMPLECEFPEGGFNANPLVYKAKLHGMGKQATQYVQGIVAGRHIAGGTTILDALTGAARLLDQERGSKNRYLVIFSDMVEESDRLKMTKAAMAPRMVDRFIARERSGPYFPRLSGVHVYVAGAGVTARATSSVKNEEIEAFWLRFLRATGAAIDPDHYGSTLTQFP